LQKGGIPFANLHAKGMMLRHARMMLEFKGEYTGIREIRKHGAWYTAGYPNSAKVRVMINEVETYNELEALLYKVCEQNR
jgi:tRNA-dihydrouridine synthase